MPVNQNNNLATKVKVSTSLVKISLCLVCPVGLLFIAYFPLLCTNLFAQAAIRYMQLYLLVKMRKKFTFLHPKWESLDVVAAFNFCFLFFVFVVVVVVVFFFFFLQLMVNSSSSQ